MDLNNKRIIKKFNKKSYNFKKIFLDHFKALNLRNLEKAHEIIPKKFLPKSIVDISNDQKQVIYKFLYKIDKGYDLKKKNKSSKFLKLYDKFIRFLAKEIFKENLVYQSKPTLRVMFPNNKAVAEFHRDRDYNHPMEEINVWVPITKSKNTNALWIESKFDKKDFKPVNLNYGQFLIFDSGLKHGNKINHENKTRFSFDFRVIPYSLWIKERVKKTKATYNQKIKFKLGGYYKLMKI